MNDQQLQQLDKILRTIEIVSPNAFSFAGQLLSNGPAVPQAHAVYPAVQPERSLIEQLQYALYSYAYIQQFTGVLSQPQMPHAPDDGFIEALSQANASRERWDLGWRIVQVAPSGQVLADKHGTTRTLWPGEFITQDGPGAPLRVGALINVYSPRESRTVQPGFYFAFSETVSEPQDVYEAVRFYWNIDPQGAIELTQHLTRILNRFHTPFRFKCCSYRALFYRSDAAVLYVNKRHYHITAEILVDVYRQVQQRLQPHTPLFTRQLAPGLAFAEEPGTGESFGMFCCRLVAEGIWHAYLQGTQSISSRLEEIKRRFASHEISLERPYLRSASVDTYEFPTY